MIRLWARVSPPSELSFARNAPREEGPSTVDITASISEKEHPCWGLCPTFQTWYRVTKSLSPSLTAPVNLADFCFGIPAESTLVRLTSPLHTFPGARSS